MSLAGPDRLLIAREVKTARTGNMRGKGGARGECRSALERYGTRHVSGNNIMIVDDNPINLKLLEDMLLKEGHRVRSFPLGRLALAGALMNPPDLILLDINMPEMNGYEVCRRLKSDARLSEIPVIFLSALNSAEDRVLCFQCGGADYVSKPFHVEEVQARVDAHLKLRNLHLETKAHNARLQELVGIQVKRIADGQMATIFALAKLTGMRDDETGRHLERIQKLCGLLAGRFAERTGNARIDHVWIENLCHASPLHDIGKVAIPDSILLKPGRLTPEEFSIMKTHAALGAQTLRAVLERHPGNQFIEMGIEIAGSHHEWWDGTGYPEGLAGEEIPLSARMLAVVDCYDAMRSKRSYKLPFPHDEVYAIIVKNSGRQFDPEVVAAFCDLADIFRDAWNSYQFPA
jgi:putative two-component system response regulator